MNIIVPKHSGFCYGVRRSVSEAFKLADEKHTYMYGEVVHNPSVVADLSTFNIKLIHSLDEIPTGEAAKVLIRAHGVPADVLDEAQARGLTVIDMTCPHVKKIHAVVAYASTRGLDVIVCGTPNHPETLGIISRVTTQRLIVKDVDEAKKVIPAIHFSPLGVCLVAQTTHNKETYEKLHHFLANECPNMPLLEPHNTICEATAFRQNELRELAQTADACIIVGGKNSSNVTKLYEIASEYCVNTRHIESAEELDASEIKNARTVIVTGGASTPNDAVHTVVEKLKEGA
ncbi:MAG: 4-hydroxy-3-methylbut-2-enyl diphosphate reductase [Defluviitaleaceae bacterium]|nr:4-hydroxy-3-methylbut-2-enyl diphosphate reductase [Defluviitaleaceae bacterium]MCL2273698.1 4-hydroxy-3-methylbut-2-enyl diphosphate reductase [Defluviitaleaceae bacterium]